MYCISNHPTGCVSKWHEYTDPLALFYAVQSKGLCAYRFLGDSHGGVQNVPLIWLYCLIACNKMRN